MLTEAACSTEYALRTIFGLVPNTTSPALSLGTAIHAAMEWDARHRRGGEAAPDGFDDMARFIERDVWDIEHVDRAIAINEEYRRTQLHQEADWELVSADREYDVPIGLLDPGGPFPELDSFCVTIKPDLLERRRSLPASAVDHFIGTAYARPRSILRCSDYKSEWSPSREGFMPWLPVGPYSGSFQGMFYQQGLRVLFPEAELEPFTIIRVRKHKPFDFEYRPITFSPIAYAAVPRVVRLLVRRMLDTHAQVLAGQPTLKNFAMCTREIEVDEGAGRKYADCTYRGLCHATSHEAAAERIQAAFVQSSSATATRVLRVLSNSEAAPAPAPLPVDKESSQA